MILMQKDMFVVREKNTSKYTRNNGFRESLDSDCQSAIKLYETEKLAKSSVRIYNQGKGFDIVPVKVTIELESEDYDVCNS